MQLNKVVGPKSRWHGSCNVGSAGKLQRAPCPILRSETLDQRGSIDAKLSESNSHSTTQVRHKTHARERGTNEGKTKECPPSFSPSEIRRVRAKLPLV